MQALARVALLAGVLALPAAGPSGAQIFQDFYGKIDQSGGLTSVSPTAAPGYIASAYYGDDPHALLLKVQPGGNLAWVQSYDNWSASAVRETAAGGFAWIGNGQTLPLVAGVDAAGTVSWAAEIFPDGVNRDQVYGRFLRVDPRDGGYWIGGEVWRQAFVDAEPWVGKLDPAGKLLWVEALSLPESTIFNSIFPALDGGVIGVGNFELKDESGAIHLWMLATKLDASGNLAWSFRYQVSNSNPNLSWQWLSDIDRDPLQSVRFAGVVGTVTHFCSNIPSLGCTNPVDSVAFYGVLDETTGALSSTNGLFAPAWKATSGNTVVIDQDSIVIGGGIMDDDISTLDGLLVRLNGNAGVTAAMKYGDGPGPFSAEVGSLARCRNVPIPGYVFLMNQIDSTGPALRLLNTLVRTDLAGNSGSCNDRVDASTFPAWVAPVSLQPAPIRGKANPISLNSQTMDLPVATCQVGPCPAAAGTAATAPAREARAPQPAKAAATATILRAIPGAPNRRNGSVPVRVPPLGNGARLGGLSGEPGERLTFRVEVPAGTRELRVEASGGKGKVLLLGRGEAAEGAKLEHAASGPSGQQLLRVSAPAAGAWSITIEGAPTFEGVTLSVSLQSH